MTTAFKIENSEQPKMKHPFKMPPNLAPLKSTFQVNISVIAEQQKLNSILKNVLLS